MSAFKDLLKRVKAAFDIDPNAAPVVPAPDPAAPVTPPAKTYKLKEGGEISVVQAGEVLAIGDTVSVNGAPATEGTLVLEDGTSLTVDATGKITLIIAPIPSTNELENQPPTQVQASADTPKTQEELEAMISKFANGTPEERLMNLEIVCKALMEQCYGWQLREAQQKALTDQAIEIYKTSLSKAEKVIDHHAKTIADIFSLMEKIVSAPTDDPETLTGEKKERFDRAEKKEKNIERFAAGIKAIRAESKK